jgi:hypothetical protein
MVKELSPPSRHGTVGCVGGSIYKPGSSISVVKTPVWSVVSLPPLLLCGGKTGIYFLLTLTKQDGLKKTHVESLTYVPW